MSPAQSENADPMLLHAIATIKAMQRITEVDVNLDRDETTVVDATGRVVQVTGTGQVRTTVRVEGY